MGEMSPDPGIVYVVGAGPGAADLITLRALRAIRRAEVLICDGLVMRSLIEELGVCTEGKTVTWLGPGANRPDQNAINEMMRDAARHGRTVVRLKGGDPFVFGRGNEEIEFLSEHGIPWEVIPGLSAATAAPTAACLPLTWRKSGRSFAVVSARRAGGAVTDSFPRADTVVILMGAAFLAEVAERLLEDGWAPETPAAVVERSTLPWERRVHGKLAQIASLAEAAHVRSPAVLVVGVAAERGHAFQERPVILFTGLDPSNFRALGDLLHWPALQIAPDPRGYAALPGVITALGHREFNWLVFTSKVGVGSFFAALQERGLDARVTAGTRVVAAGAGTADRLREYNVRADSVPAEPGSRGILSSLGHLDGASVLLIQGSHAPADLAQEINRLGGQVTRLALHRVAPHPELGRPLPAHDVVYFVSPSGARAYWQVYGAEAFRREIWCIGKATLAELEKLGQRARIVEPYVSSDQNEKIAAQ